MRRSGLSGLLATLATVWLAGTPAAASAAEKVVTFSRPEDLTVSLDTANHFNLINFGLEKLLYDYLVELGPDGRPVARLAESWTVAPDGKAVTFKLRKGVAFHNGEPFTSASVKATLERFLTEKLAQGFLWSDLAGVDTPADDTAVIRLKQPYGPLLSNLTHTPMLPANAFRQQGVELFKKPVGTGPFTFVEGAKGDRFVFAANKRYWRPGLPKVDRIVYKPILESSTALAAFQRGDVDIVDSVPPDLIGSVRQVRGAQIVRGLAWDQLYMGLKVDKPPFDNPKVRQAINLAIDREGIVESVMLGGRPAVQLVPQGVLGFADELKPIPYDPARAKALLAEAGVQNATISLIAPQGWYPKIAEVTEVLRANLQEIGLNTRLQVMEGAAFTQARGAGNYDIYVTGGSHVGGDPDFFMMQRVVNDVFKSGFKDPQTTDPIRRAREATGREERAALYEQAQARMHELSAPFVWLFQMENVYAVSGRVSGFVFAPNKAFDLRNVDLK